MLDLGYISQSEYSEAIAEPINIKLPKAADKVASSVEDLIEYNVIDALIEHLKKLDEVGVDAVLVSDLGVLALVITCSIMVD